MSTIAAIRRETKSFRWPAFVLAYTYAIAYVAALVVYQVSGLLGVAWSASHSLRFPSRCSGDATGG